MKKELEEYKWEKWIERPFQAFTLSLFEDSYRKESFEELGFKGIDERPQFFQNRCWYYCDEEMQKMDEQLGKYLDLHSMKEVTKGLGEFKQESQSIISKLIKSNDSVEERFEKVFRILKNACTYIWLAHGFDSYYSRKLKVEVPKYVPSDIDKFIGDASFPKKKNSNAILDTLLRGNFSNKEIVDRAGWIKIRDGFSAPFSEEEIESMRKNLKPLNEPPKVKVPSQLKDLFEEVQELVFFRTERTDVFYQLYYQARPILKELAEKYDIPFEEMRYYRAKSFLTKKPERYSAECTFAFINGKVLFQNEPLLFFDEQLSSKISGTVAFKGNVQGIVKIVKDVPELGKVKEGDILVTQMTFPSFIPAMVKAIAFVTDEGGLTCHAAIVSRELNVPCIVGAKIATKVLNDGDIVEVNANHAVVTILEKSKK